MIFKPRHSNDIVWDNLREEIVRLFLERMRIRYANTKFKTLSPHRHELIGMLGAKLLNDY